MSLVDTSSGRVLAAAERKRRNRDQMEAAILDAARAIMREEGAAALNLHEVARRVGLRTPSLYAYFDGKTALYDALFRLGIEIYGERAREALQEPRPVWEQLRVSIEAYMTFAFECPELYQLVFERPVPGFVPSEESLTASFSLLAWANAQIEDSFRAAGIVPPIPFNQATDMIIALQHGLTALHMANEPDLPPGEGRFGSLIEAAVALIRYGWDTKPAESRRHHDANSSPNL